MTIKATKMKVVDSHTAGEPTRVIVDGGPDLGGGTLGAQLERFKQEHDDIRTRVILEPRGSDALVGALLCDPVESDSVAGVIFFNNAGYLGMCGHGMMGLVVTLYHLGKIGLGVHKIDTAVGAVRVTLHDQNSVSIENVPSYCYRESVEISVKGLGLVTGDIAWGGNWFFLVQGIPVTLKLENVASLTRLAKEVKRALASQGITGAEGQEIDHIEFFSAPLSVDANSRNFVLCPGGAYDRSPCGTGTSAKLACLAAKEKLGPGETWVQESVIGSTFSARYSILSKDRIIPTISSQAFICAESTLVVQSGDPFRDGIQ